MANTGDLLKAALADRYRIEREIGQGGMATVYLAEDLKHHRKVAVKVLRPEIAATLGSDRFFREIEVAAQLQHPHILPLLDSGETQGFYYYVMPFIAGESLRERLAKAGELPIHDAVKILSEVVDALAAAHAMGVVHRDIKPDNVMLSGRHASVTDFGVAKAVSEATGRNQLTTAGVALGTPYYMAPEQAAADPNIDHRVDIYAVGAMGYELLTGKPPFTGGTAAEILRAHVTRAPEPVTSRRSACPPQLGAVIMRCLEKRPADRWQSAEELLNQLEPLATPSGGVTPTQTRPVAAVQVAKPKRLIAVMILGTLVALVFGANILANRREARVPATLRDRIQLTTTGDAAFPAISPDGKQLAYAVSTCDPTCLFSVHIKDIDGAGARMLLDSATAIYGMTWSVDRRNLLVAGTIGGRFGVFLVSTVGAPPRRVSAANANFCCGADSLLLTKSLEPDTLFWIAVAGLDGVRRDSLPVRAAASQGVFVVGWPEGSPWILAVAWRPPVAELLSIDRHGRVGGRTSVENPSGPWRASKDAVWALQEQPGSVGRRLLVRIPFDSRTGQFSSRWDTLYAGTVSTFDVTGDGGRFVITEGTSQYTGWALDLKDALSGRYTQDQRLMQSTAQIALGISPDGNRVIVRRSGSGPSDQDNLAVFPYPRGAEMSLPISGKLLGLTWRDSVTLGLFERTSAGDRFTPVDVRTGGRGEPFAVPDSGISDVYASLPDGGWAWVPAEGQSIKVQEPGDSAPKVFPVPETLGGATGVANSPDGKNLAFLGWKPPSYDSIGLNVLSLRDGKITPWYARFSEGASFKWLADGSIYLASLETQQARTAFRISGPGKVERLGTFPRWVVNGQISADMRRVAVVTLEIHGDVWMSTVVR